MVGTYFNILYLKKFLKSRISKYSHQRRKRKYLFKMEEAAIMWSQTAGSSWKIETENCKACYTEKTFHLLHLSGLAFSGAIFKAHRYTKSDNICIWICFVLMLTTTDRLVMLKNNSLLTNRSDTGLHAVFSLINNASILKYT